MKGYEYRLAGSGGQGLILAGIILAEAAGVYEGYSVVQTQSYGPESRGGASRAEVILSDEAIDYPKVTQPNVLLCLTQEACRRYAADLADDGLVQLRFSIGQTLAEGFTFLDSPVAAVVAAGSDDATAADTTSPQAAKKIP